MPTKIIGDFPICPTIIIEDPTINFWLGMCVENLETYEFLGSLISPLRMKTFSPTFESVFSQKPQTWAALGSWSSLSWTWQIFDFGSKIWMCGRPGMVLKHEGCFILFAAFHTLIWVMFPGWKLVYIRKEIEKKLSLFIISASVHLRQNFSSNLESLYACI